MGTLYIVATPIGNLEDITIRAIKTLLTADVICAEDTRRTGQLLKLLEERYATVLNVQKNSYQQFVSYYDQTEEKKAPEIIQRLEQGKNIALVSDAGTPLINDPGYKLVTACVKRGIPIVSIPGPSSVITAVTVSGFPTDQFLFLGYLASSQQKRKNQLTNLFQCFKSLKFIHPTVVLFESPHRLHETVTDVQSIFGDIEIVITREMTKVHEEIWRGKISDVPQWMKGEIVLLFRPAVHAE